MSHVLIPIPAVHITDGTCPLPPAPGPGLHEETGSVLDAVNAWHAQGARWIHLVDGDARSSSGHNRAAVKDVVHHHKGTIHFQLSGGITDETSLGDALATGASRVVIDVGSASDRDWVYGALTRHDVHAAAGLDVHGTDLVAADGTVVGNVFDAVIDLEAHGCPRYVVTEAAHRGHWHHGDTHVLAAICETVRHPVIAFGGVTHLSDLHRLEELASVGLEGVVIDEPLYSGRFTYAEATAAGQPRFDPYQWAPPRP